MITSIADNEILQLLKQQLANNFLLTDNEKDALDNIYSLVLEKIEYCFYRTENKYYKKLIEKGKIDVFFNPYHSCQYTIFLYFYSKLVIEHTNEILLSDKIYYLNKMLNGCDLYHQIELPNFWGCEHPLGSIMGRAEYGEGFYFYQCCTVGGNHNNYLVIGENVRMFSHSQIIGNSHIGNNVKIGAGCLIKDQDVPSNSICFGQSPHLIIKELK